MGCELIKGLLQRGGGGRACEEEEEEEEGGLEHIPQISSTFFIPLLSLKTEENKLKSLNIWLFLILHRRSFCLILYWF